MLWEILTWVILLFHAIFQIVCFDEFECTESSDGDEEDESEADDNEGFQILLSFKLEMFLYTWSAPAAAPVSQFKRGNLQTCNPHFFLNNFLLNSLDLNIFVLK